MRCQLQNWGSQLNPNRYFQVESFSMVSYRILVIGDFNDKIESMNLGITIHFLNMFASFEVLYDVS